MLALYFPYPIPNPAESVYFLGYGSYDPIPPYYLYNTLLFLQSTFLQV